MLATRIRRILTGLLCDDQNWLKISFLPFFVFYQCYLEHWRRRSPYSFLQHLGFCTRKAHQQIHRPIAIHAHSCSHNEQVYIHRKWQRHFLCDWIHIAIRYYIRNTSPWKCGGKWDTVLRALHHQQKTEKASLTCSREIEQQWFVRTFNELFM